MIKVKQTADSLYRHQPGYLIKSILEDAGMKKQYEKAGSTVYVCEKMPRDMKYCFIFWEQVD